MDTVLNKVKHLCTDILILFKEVDALLTTPLHSPQTQMSCSWAYARRKAHVKNKLLRFIQHVRMRLKGNSSFTAWQGNVGLQHGRRPAIVYMWYFTKVLLKSVYKKHSQNLLSSVFNACKTFVYSMMRAGWFSSVDVSDTPVLI